ncbi:MAG: ribosome biogenesis GTP-binding protein YihA/YsxC, partial [Clostridia bacterium]|nr:ribosome biogenesis GTP-binding protein YihA/YsxC [Clostridia bacterium]
SSAVKNAVKRWEFWVSIVGFLIEAGLLAFSIYYTADKSRKLSAYTHINATTVDYKLEPSGHGKDKHYYYHAVVEYKVDGVKYTARDMMSVGIGDGVGKLKEIAYNPDNPAECLFVKSEKSGFAFLFSFTILWTAAPTAIAVVFVQGLKREKLMNTYSNAKFITSAASKAQFIQSDKPIIAVCGKSNVGKSSFINMLANQNKLAKVSGEPGRTRLVNYFDFGDFILADLPGYGYAKVSKAEKLKWAQLLDDFFAGEHKIAHVFALCDIRHEPTADDRVMVNFLYERIIPFTVIATKADKLSRAQQQRALTMLSTAYTCGKDAILPTSAKTRQGMERVIEEIKKVVELNGKK